MSGAFVLGLGEALVGAAGYGTGSVLQAVGVARRTGARLPAHPAYVLGLGCDLVAWAASLAALRHLPLFAVQSILASSLAVTVVLARVVLAVRVSRREQLALLVVVTSVAVLAGAAVPGRPPPVGRLFGVLAALGLLALLPAAVVAAQRRAPTALAVLAGLGYSGAAVAARGVHAGGAVPGLAAQPAALAVLGYGLLGTLLYAQALAAGHYGGVTRATSWLWSVEVVVPAVIGVAALDDRVRPGWWVPAAMALVATLAGGAALSAAEARQDSRAAVTTGR